MSFESDWQNPPREFSLMPFWFWNDTLDEAELLRQLDAFERNGVYGFVIHPRVGLPRDCGWMSERLLGFYRIAIEAAARRDMRVLLYDEGMYPSGSSSGQLVAAYPDLACRCLALHDAGDPLPAGANVVQKFVDGGGAAKWIVDRPVDSVIRGLHYLGEPAGGGGQDPPEDQPPAGDILNPRTAAAILDLVHNRFFEHFGQHFGKTILGVFTDEPGPLGRCREKNVFPGTTGIVPHLSRLLGYDVARHLPELWSADPAAAKFRDDFRHAVRMRLEETWYRPLSEWCESKGVALCGHPDAGDEIGVQRFFQIPGQDLVWRWVAPGQPSALEGSEATQGKCGASAMAHAGRRRNSNEFAGAYGAETTFDEIRWLANWCLIRGVNLLIPHAFYYSVRGARKDERPPQIGPHTPQWDDLGPVGFRTFADHCRRMSWLNADSLHLCHTAILTHADRCPWPAAAAVHRAGRDFNYLDPHTLRTTARIDAGGIHVGPMRYTRLIVDGDAPLGDELTTLLRPMIDGGGVVRYANDVASPIDGLPVIDSPADLVARIDAGGRPPIEFESDGDGIRVRSVRKSNRAIHLFFNENAHASAFVRFPGVRPLIIGLDGLPEKYDCDRIMLRPAMLVAMTT